MTMLAMKLAVQMTRETEDKDPVNLPVEVEVDNGGIWVYVSKEDIQEALAAE